MSGEWGLTWVGGVLVYENREDAERAQRVAGSGEVIPAETCPECGQPAAMHTRGGRSSLDRYCGFWRVVTSPGTLTPGDADA